MTLDEASKIVQIWGIYLEYFQGKLIFIFSASIPESFLPFPLKTIEEAVNIVTEQHHNTGNQEAVRALQVGIAALSAYADDEEAVLSAAKAFNDEKWRQVMLPALKKFQMDWIKSQGDFNL
ncbi:MAG: hypothetical protein AAB581_02290 [Patescibacteria group bacterium]